MSYNPTRWLANTVAIMATRRRIKTQKPLRLRKSLKSAVLRNILNSLKLVKPMTFQERGLISNDKVY